MTLLFGLLLLLLQQGGMTRPPLALLRMMCLKGDLLPLPESPKVNPQAPSAPGIKRPRWLKWRTSPARRVSVSSLTA